MTDAPRTSPLKNARDGIESNPYVHRAMAALGDAVHPNRLSALRMLPGLAAIPAHAAGYPMAAAGLAAFAALADWADGAAARASGRFSAEGARLDPFVDKIVHGAQMSYLAVLGAASGYAAGQALAVSAAVGIVVDAVLQRARGPFSAQWSEAVRAVRDPGSCPRASSPAQANFLGKSKFFLQAGGILAVLAAGAGETPCAVAATGFSAAAVLGAVGGVMRSRAAVAGAAAPSRAIPPK